MSKSFLEEKEDTRARAHTRTHADTRGERACVRERERERETCDVVQSPLVPCTGKEKEDEENKRVRNDDDDDDMSHTSRRNTFCVGEEKETNETPEQKKEKKTRSADREREGGENARSVVAEETETPSSSLPWTKKSDIAKKTFGVGREGGPVVKEEEDGEERITRGRRGRVGRRIISSYIAQNSIGRTILSTPWTNIFCGQNYLGKRKRARR